MHGHSRKMKSFFYGVNHPNKILSRRLPYFLSKISKNVSFEDSIFHLSKSKSGTARGVLYKITSCPYIYTY